MKLYHSGTLLIRSPLGPKKIGRINEGFLQENVWRFLLGSQKKEVAVNWRGSTVLYMFEVKLHFKRGFPR